MNKTAIRPSPYHKTYFVIQCTKGAAQYWALKGHGGYWIKGTQSAQRFDTLAAAKKRVAYLESRKAMGCPTWEGCALAVIRVVSAKTIEVVHPLSALDQLAKV